MSDGADDEAEAFCRGLYPRLAGALTLHCGDPGVGEELAQEALLRVWQRWSSVRAMASPEGWAFRVGFNLSTSRFRRVLAERRANQRLGVRTEVLSPLHDDLLAVRAAVAELPPRQRAAVVLRYFADLSIDQAAAAMGCAPGTVKSLTSQGVAALRVRLVLIEEVLDA
jgi:RNA polymerase sigma-70 factor (ECF subfamily)